MASRLLGTKDGHPLVCRFDRVEMEKLLGLITNTDQRCRRQGMSDAVGDNEADEGLPALLLYEHDLHLGWRPLSHSQMFAQTAVSALRCPPVHISCYGAPLTPSNVPAQRPDRGLFVSRGSSGFLLHGPGSLRAPSCGTRFYRGGGPGSGLSEELALGV